MRALAITGIETASMMAATMSGSLIRATPPWARMSAGTRSSAITATAPASSAIFACSGVTTSMITPPLSISAMPRFTRVVPCSATYSVELVFMFSASALDDVDRETAPRGLLVFHVHVAAGFAHGLDRLVQADLVAAGAVQG